MESSAKSEITPLQSPTETPSADTLVFEYSVMMRIMMWVCVIICLGFVAFAVVTLSVRTERGSLTPVLLLFLAVFGGGLAYSVRIVRYSRDRIAVDSQGIRYLAKNGLGSFLAWSEVAAIKANDTMQRLSLSDASGARTIRVEYQIGGFAALRDFILSHTDAQALQPQRELRVFHRSWINKIILAAFGLLFASVLLQCYRKGDTVGICITSVFVSLILLGIAMDPVALTIGVGGLMIRYPLWSRSVPFDSISGVSLQDINARGNVWAAVVIDRKGEKAIRLFRFREGSLALRDAIESAWRSSGAFADPAEEPPTRS